MDPLQMILLVFAVVCGVWQAVLLTAWVAMLASGKYNNVKVGLLPGALAVALAIAVILL